MKKSTIVIIIAIYLVSIVVISFLGIKVRVYDETKYVKEIQISVGAEDENRYSLENLGKDSLGNNQYSLTIYFKNAKEGKFPMKSDPSIEITRKYLILSLIPHITYDTGDVANAEEESIVFKIGNESYQEKEWITLSEKGFITAFRKDISTPIYVTPAKSGRVGAGATIYVSVVW